MEHKRRWADTKPVSLPKDAVSVPKDAVSGASDARIYWRFRTAIFQLENFFALYGKPALAYGQIVGITDT